MAGVGERICGPGAAAGAQLRKASVHTFENAPSASANGEDERTQEEGKGIRTPTWPWCLTFPAAGKVGTWLALGKDFRARRRRWGAVEESIGTYFRKCPIGVGKC